MLFNKSLKSLILLSIVLGSCAILSAWSVTDNYFGNKFNTLDARAFAMGGAGTHIAMEAADVVVMNDDLGRLSETIRLSKRTQTILWQNITLALGIKLVFLLLAIFDNASMWMAVFADMGASLLVIGNGLRMLRR